MFFASNVNAGFASFPDLSVSTDVCLFKVIIAAFDFVIVPPIVLTELWLLVSPSNTTAYVFPYLSSVLTAGAYP